MEKRTVLSLAAIIGSAFFGFYFSNRVLYIKKKSEQKIIERETKLHHFDPAVFSSLPKTEVWIPSPNGYNIHTVFIRPYPAKRFVVFSHGVTENKISSLKYANIFLERGFNAVIYDQRRHGKTGGKTTSYGYFEKYDLQAVVDRVFQEEGDDVLVGVHGESMGAATALLYAGELSGRAHFYIADCPFSNLNELLSYRLSCEIPCLPPKLLLLVGDLFLKLWGQFSAKDVSPINVVSRIQQPVLFIHSKKDDFILPSMTETLYKQKKGEKMFFSCRKRRTCPVLERKSFRL